MAFVVNKTRYIKQSGHDFSDTIMRMTMTNMDSGIPYWSVVGAYDKLDAKFRGSTQYTRAEYSLIHTSYPRIPLYKYIDLAENPVLWHWPETDADEWRILPAFGIPPVFEGGLDVFVRDLHRRRSSAVKQPFALLAGRLNDKNVYGLAEATATWNTTPATYQRIAQYFLTQVSTGLSGYHTHSALRASEVRLNMLEALRRTRIEGKLKGVHSAAQDTYAGSKAQGNRDRATMRQRHDRAALIEQDNRAMSAKLLVQLPSKLMAKAQQVTDMAKLKTFLGTLKAELSDEEGSIYDPTKFNDLSAGDSAFFLAGGSHPMLQYEIHDAETKRLKEVRDWLASTAGTAHALFGPRVDRLGKAKGYNNAVGVHAI